jgi:hypothetical protein
MDCMEVIGVELIGGMDLGSVHNRQMEHARDRRREFERRAGGRRCRAA